MRRNITLGVLAFVVVVLMGVAVWRSYRAGTTTTNGTENETPAFVITPVVLQSPKSNTSYSADIVIEGTGPENLEMRAYVNYKNDDLKCITRTKQANGGSVKANEAGAFRFALDNKAYATDMNIIVVAIDSETYGNANACIPVASLSEPIRVTYTGKLPK